MRRVTSEYFQRMGLSVCGISIDGAAKLASQVWGRRESAPGDEVPFDFGEPDLNLIQPRGVGRREVLLHVRVRFQKISDRLSLYVPRNCPE